MGRLSFEIKFRSVELGSVDLPIEIRKPNLALVKRCLASQSVDLEPGVYHIIAKLPAGQMLYNRVIIVGDVHVTAVLAPTPEDTPPHEWQETHCFLEESLDEEQITAPHIRRVELMGFHGVQASLRIFIGNILLQTYRIKPAGQRNASLREQGNGMQFHISGAEEMQLAQLIQPLVPVSNVVLPVFGNENRCLITITRSLNGIFSIEPHLQNMRIDILLRYNSVGYLQQAAAAVDLLSIHAGESLAPRNQDPMVAAVIAYTLLRIGQLEPLSDWVEYLQESFPWLSDGIIIRGEHQARLGYHSEALATLMELPARGLPIFCSGLTYAVDRLRFYIKLEESGFAPPDLFQARILLTRLLQFATYVDFRRPILSFTGLDPSYPNDEPYGEDVAHIGDLLF